MKRIEEKDGRIWIEDRSDSPEEFYPFNEPIPEIRISRPTVTMKFVKRWSRAIGLLPIQPDVENWTIEMPKQIKQMLTEAGVEIEK